MYPEAIPSFCQEVSSGKDVKSSLYSKISVVSVLRSCRALNNAAMPPIYKTILHQFQQPDVASIHGGLDTWTQARDVACPYTGEVKSCPLPSIPSSRGYDHMCPERFDLKTIEIEVNEEDKICYLLSSLPKNYDQVITSIETMATEEKISFDFVPGLLSYGRSRRGGLDQGRKEGRVHRGRFEGEEVMSLVSKSEIDLIASESDSGYAQREFMMTPIVNAQQARQNNSTQRDTVQHAKE
ncbi:hypothetical protein evm_014111 [Chilo suppressalis]|nr:hypothetical protein evm_014111 [Chilo suppressalis]